MKRIPVHGVQPSVLRWARESLELSIESVARHLKCDPSRIISWENGSDAPTYAELEKLAYSFYKRPLAMFFLPSPPIEQPIQKEFRTLPQFDMEHLEADTILQIRKGKAYQMAIREVFGNRNPAARPIWRELSLNMSQGIPVQAAKVREFLGISLEQQSVWRSDERGIKEWRNALETLGVFVFKASFKQKEISGFCLPDDDFPVVYLNNSTTKTRQIFSLMHELAHILLQIKGLSRWDTGYIDSLPREMAQIERFCNALAAEILIPIQDFLERTSKWPQDVAEIAESAIEDLAAHYSVSREAILRRFLDLGRVTRELYAERSGKWSAQIKQSGSGNWFASQNAYLSPRFAREVVSKHYNSQITVEEASEILGIHPKNFEGIEERILQGALA